MPDALQSPTDDDRLAKVMLAHVNEAIVVCDEAGVVIHASRVARQFCQADPVGRHFEEVYPVKPVDGSVLSVARACECEQRVEATLPLGERNVSLQLDVHRLADPVAGRAGFVVVMTDVSERRRAEERVLSSQAELRQLLETAERSRRALLSVLEDERQTQRALGDSEQQFRGLVEQSMAGIYIMQHGALAYVNPRYAEILGYGSPGELIGLDPRSFVDPRDRAIITARSDQLAGGDALGSAYTVRLIRKDGSLIDVNAHDMPSSYRGEPSIIGLMLDVTAQKRAEAEASRFISQLKSAFLQTVEVATTIAQMRDPYTANHAKRVAHLLTAMGQELGWDPQRVEGLSVGGYLHDIGTIRIPAEIIIKPGRLSPVEMRLIRTHPSAGFEILKIVDFPWPVAQMTLQHHERLDGSGYPAGLKGDDIIPEARLLAVADVVEAMCSHRPYRPALGIDQALAEIEAGRGTRYCPDAVEACTRLFRERGYSLPAE